MHAWRITRLAASWLRVVNACISSTIIFAIALWSVAHDTGMALCIVRGTSDMKEVIQYVSLFYDTP